MTLKYQSKTRSNQSQRKATKVVKRVEKLKKSKTATLFRPKKLKIKLKRKEKNRIMLLSHQLKAKKTKYKNPRANQLITKPN